MRKTILIVEDDAASMKLFCDILEAKGYATLQCTRGVDAVRIAKESLPNLILLDLFLTDILGIEVSRSLKKAAGTTKRIPIIAVSAFAKEKDREMVLSYGCDIYVAKPISVQVLIDAIHSLLIGN